jgi:hypothetical protein
MATAGGPSGTILAIHLQICSHLSNKITEIVYDNKNHHITELEDTRPVFILFYLLVIKDNDPAVKI